VVVIAMLVPFATDAKPASKVATALINLAIGIAITSFVESVGRAATGSPLASTP
jgi:hypothetical protein